MVDQKDAKLSFGIDLGTTFCCVYMWDASKQQAVAILNPNGNKVTPSFLSYVGSSTVVGDAAKTKMVQNHTGVIYDVKRFIGKSYKEFMKEFNVQDFNYKI